MASSTADRVRAAALALFAERGYHGTGIRDLAQAAGLSSASLYHYMGTKEDLLAALMRESIGRLLAQGERVVAGGTTPTDRLVALVDMHVRAHAEDPPRTRVVDDEVRSLTGPARAEVVALRDRYERLWQETIEAGVEAGEFDVRDPALARRALLEMCSGVARWWDPTGPLSLEALGREYAGLARRLLGASAATRRGE